MKFRFVTTPYILWIVLFTIIPLSLIIFYGVTIDTAEGIKFSFENIIRIFEPIYLKALIRSIWLALICTVICLGLAYPLAYILSKRQSSRTSTILFILILPMWMNFLLRTYAWLTLLEKNGFLNTVLNFLGLNNINILYTNTAVVLGMVYNFLPFMVLPIYNVLCKIDRSLIEASEDLGANTMESFIKVIFPLSLPGVLSGITMVFMPAVTTFVIPNLLGGGQITLIGNLIENQFLSNYDWNFGSSLSLVLMVVILLSMSILSKSDENKGVGLW